jgi:lactobin A/cerein 7B family class IIb bacteriocin
MMKGEFPMAELQELNRDELAQVEGGVAPILVFGAGVMLGVIVGAYIVAGAAILSS